MTRLRFVPLVIPLATGIALAITVGVFYALCYF